MTTAVSLLDTERIRVSYGSSVALDDVSLHIARGDTLAVLGTNGAGKSSLGRALSGLVTPSRGQVFLEGRDVTSMAVHRIRRMGLAYLPEGRGIFHSLSVQDNLRMGARWLPTKPERRAAIDIALELFPVLAQRKSQVAGTLSGGEQQMLSLARGLAVWPQVLIADEVSLGLAPKIVDFVFEQLEVIRTKGVTLVLIEQFVNRVLSFATRAVVLSQGTVAWTGSTQGLTEHDITAYYFGRSNATTEQPV